jgi:hypothetical protein
MGMTDVDVTTVLDTEGRPANVINTTEINTGQLAQDPQMREIASKLSRWVDNARNATGRTSMFDRGMFTPPDNPYDEMRAARNAVKYDATVAGVGETTEAYAFQGVKWEGTDPDEADVFNQLARDQNLDAVIRAMWREEFACGQFVAAKIWGWREYVVRGRTKSGNRRKKTYRVWAPLQVRVLDSAKVVPVGVGPLGGEMLAWQATKHEIGSYQAAYSGDRIDPLMTTFFQGTYNPDFDEAGELAQLGVDPTRLLVMNPNYVFRHTLTKPDYERFAEIRLKSLFGILDLKRQLMAADRASLIGAANYILLIRKGEKDAPALPEEMQNLRENYNFLAKMPVIISDHRLSIDIIAPKVDFTLNPEKYGVLDARILTRLLGTLTLGGSGQRNETQETLSSAVARVMENRRHMLKRSLELQLARAVVEHPKNEGVFQTEPNLVYTPRNVALSLDASYLQGLLALRTQREISRETILEFMGLDEATEAQRVEMEEEVYDDIFKTQVPFAAQGVGNGGAQTPNGTPEDPAVSGSRGGRPVGGGESKKSPAAIAKPKTSNGNPATGAS